MNNQVENEKKNWLSEGKNDHLKERFGRFYDEFAPQIFRHALARVNNQAVAQDITAQAFLKTWDYLQDDRNSIENLKSFVYRTSHNLISDFYRGQKHEEVDITVYTETGKHLPFSDDLHHKAEERELIKEVEDIISILDEDYRDIIVWKYVDDLTVEEICEITGKTANNVYVMLHRALKKARTLMEAKGF